MILTNDELISLKGGAFNLRTAILVGIGGLITLLVGVMDGYMNPQACNMKKN